MIKHFKYLSYVVRHKWYVLQECHSRGILLQGLIHDWSKFLPDEWFPYAEHFHGKKPPKEIKSKNGYLKPASTGDKAFDEAWLRHIHRNPHHWQHYILAATLGSIKVFEMPLHYRKEMLADWVGANKAQGGTGDIRKWYIEHKGKLMLGEETKKWIEERLG